MIEYVVREGTNVNMSGQNPVSSIVYRVIGQEIEEYGPVVISCDMYEDAQIIADDLNSKNCENQG
jgi:hypothetical protein